MRKICIAISKGGTAKTTTAISLAHGLALAGKKTLLIDTDSQGQCSYMLGAKPKYGLANVLNGDISVKEAVFKARNNLYLLGGGSELAFAKKDIGSRDIGAERVLYDCLESVEGQYDFVVIDTSPAFDSLTINALFYCKEILTPISLEVLTLNSLADFVGKIANIKKYNPELSHCYLLPTFQDKRVKKSKEILQILKKHYKDILCEPVRYSARISESAGYGESIFEFDKSAKVTTDYKNLVKKVLRYGKKKHT